ncbi:MAG: sensor histidine kinase [Bacteroidetes bacterium]|jgi:two-component system phosphate regulon sensor histidine kinase PhoR|nr:sensor histidine kinase [Bacteroidota bacterium]
MKTTSPRQMAIYIALLTSVIAGLVLIITHTTDYQPYWLPLIFSLLFVFIIIYLIVYYWLNSFIFEKINPIYKTIHQVNIPEKELRQDLEEKDVISEVKNEVLQWAKRKTREIAQLKQMEKYRKEFLGNVSHELKTPIFNIQGYILTLLDGGLEDTSINRLYLERTEKSINRMISIVNDLESIARLEAGEMKLEMDDFNIITLFEESFEMNEMMAEERGIRLKFDHKYEKPVKVHGDKRRIMEVINNLVVNSIKYGSPKGTTIVGFSDMGENTLVEVTDDGIGIPEHDINRIFERFYRTDKSRSRDMGGTGLGLSIVKHIIEAHNQTINVRSSVGNGSSFAFTLKKAKGG